MKIGKGFFTHAFTNALEELGEPTRIAIYLYDFTVPSGIFMISFDTFCSKTVSANLNI